MRALLVVNPKATATTPRARDVLSSALAAELKLDVVETQRRGHAIELAEAARADGIDLVVALGGDGTVNECVNGLLQRGPGEDVPMFAVVPGGSTNVFARVLGFPNSAVEATGEILELLRAGSSRSIGLGQANGRWFAFCAGMGLDAATVQRVERKRAKGKRATNGLFVRNTLAQFFLHEDRRQPAITVEVPGAEPVEGVYMSIVSNCAPWTFLGNLPVTTTPAASFETGLDLFGVTRMSTARMLRAAAQAFGPRGPRGKHVVALHDLSELTLRATRPLAVEVDGDDIGTATELHLASTPAALRVIASPA